MVELAARVGGGHDAELCEAALGVDLNGLAIDGGAAGSRSSRRAPEPRVGGACVRFLVAPPGVLERVDGIEEATGASRASAGCASTARPGYVLVPLRRGSDRAGAILAVGRLGGGRRWRGPTRPRSAYASRPRMPKLSSSRKSFLGFQPPAVGEEEIAAVAETIRSGWLTTGPKAAELEARARRAARGGARARRLLGDGGAPPGAARGRRRGPATR